MTLTPEERVATLSPREFDVARLAARGFSARYIARRYGISDRTVETHTRHIYEKLLVSTRDALIESFADLLLVDPAPAPEAPPFAPRLAPVIPLGLPAIGRASGVLHIAAERLGTLCGVTAPTHITDGPRYADCPDCLRKYHEALA